MSMEAVIAQLQQTRDEYLREVELIDKMLTVYTERHAVVQLRQLTNDRRRAKAGDKDAKKRVGQNGKEKKEYKVSQKILDEIKTAIQDRLAKGEAFIEALPGSFTTNIMVETTKHNPGTIRKALKQLEEEGVVRKAERMSWRQLGDTPQGPTDVFVAQSTEDLPALRGWNRSTEGEQAQSEATADTR